MQALNLLDPPALDHDTVLIEAVKHADLQVNARLNHPYREADCHTSHLDGYLFEPICVKSQTFNTISFMLCTHDIHKMINMLCLTGLLVMPENLMWKSSLASPGIVGVKTISSFMLSKGPTSPSLTCKWVNTGFLNILFYSSASLRNILQEFYETNGK